MEPDKIERIERLFRRRYRIKKAVNLAVSALIVVLGITSLVFIWNCDRDGVMTFRWMTVDGTLFTTAIAAFYIAAGIIEMVFYTELTNRGVYYVRLASAVAESLILIVVLLSRLPFSPDKMHIYRYDMFNMHLLIPVLTVLSFILNDSPIGKLSFRQKMQGMLFVMLYAAVILTLIVTGIIPYEQIPYYFLDVEHMPVTVSVGWFVFIFVLSYLLSLFLSGLNRRLSWVWFRNVARDRCLNDTGIGNIG